MGDGGRSERLCWKGEGVWGTQSKKGVSPIQVYFKNQNTNNTENTKS